MAEKLLRYWKMDVFWRTTWLYFKPVSDWLLLNTKWAIFSAISGQEQVALRRYIDDG
jgi:hypothetical protein